MEFKLLRAPSPCLPLLAGPTPATSSYSIQSPKRTDLGFGWHLCSKKMIHSIRSKKSRASNDLSLLAMEQCYDATTKTLSLKVRFQDKAKSNDMETRIKEVDAIVAEIVGMEGLKTQLRKWIKGLVVKERRKELNLKVGKRKALHMAFLGNPGTGKTMVARILGKILNKLGLTEKDDVVEVQRTDLVAKYIGQTGVKTREKIEEASGGILFVDEAYRLMPPDSMRDFGREALEEIMSAMNEGDIVVIFAGYTKEMQRVISANPGFSRRVSKFFYFDDYTPTDIATVLRMKIEKQNEDSFTYGLILHSDCTVEAISGLIKKHATEEQLTVLNGGLVDPWLVNAMENLDLRVDMGASDGSTLLTVTMEDLEEGIKSLACLKKRDSDDSE